MMKYQGNPISVDYPVIVFFFFLVSIEKTNGCIVTWLLFPFWLSRKLKSLSANVVPDFISVSALYVSPVSLYKPT